MGFTSRIIKWYIRNKRELPWRGTRDPYRIWLSEVILQQTRVEQGLKYYIRFIDNFPTVCHLAKAPPEKVMKLWQGLGYYSRARNLHETAKYIVKECHGKFPSDYQALKRMKGIGAYTAAAIASFAFDKPFAAVDGNVIRVISRVFGIRGAVDKPEIKKEIAGIASRLISVKEPALFNQAMMEFGAVQCRPKNPSCSECCVSNTCYAYANKLVHMLPCKTKKGSSKNRFLNYILVSCAENKTEFIYIRKRTSDDIWKSMYDFPCIETSTQSEPEQIISSAGWKALFGNKRPVVTAISGIIKHQLSHQNLHVRFFEVSVKTPLRYKGQVYKRIKKTEFEKYAVPRLIERYFRF